MKRKVIVTTAGRPDEQTEKSAGEAALILDCVKVPRRKQSVQRLMRTYDADVLVAGKERFELFRKGMDAPFFFHPDTASFRLKRLMRGETDPLVEACRLTGGESFLDCTLGLATDSIVASYAVGETGKVRGIEIDRDIAFITASGLARYEPGFNELKASMRRISVVNAAAVSYLADTPDSSWDVVFIDPMFSEPIQESDSFAPLRQAGAHGGLSEAWAAEAKRVAKKRVVVKAHFKDPVFAAFGFEQVKRPNTKFHYGIIEK